MPSQFATDTNLNEIIPDQVIEKSYFISERSEMPQKTTHTSILLYVVDFLNVNLSKNVKR